MCLNNPSLMQGLRYFQELEMKGSLKESEKISIRSIEDLKKRSSINLESVLQTPLKINQAINQIRLERIREKEIEDEQEDREDGCWKQGSAGF